jgi:predicted ATP-grasp superfamily ATP-dependent carboligase
VKADNKQAIDAAQFLRLQGRGMVLVHAKGVNLAKICEANRIPYRVVKGLYVQMGAKLVSSSRNCVAVKRAQLPRLKNAIAKRSVSVASKRGASRY